MIVIANVRGSKSHDTATGKKRPRKIKIEKLTETKRKKYSELRAEGTEEHRAPVRASHHNLVQLAALALLVVVHLDVHSRFTQSHITRTCTVGNPKPADGTARCSADGEEAERK